MAKKGGGATFLKVGCLGCLGFLALVVLIVAIVGGIAWRRAGQQKIADQVFTQEIPASPEATPEPLADVDGIEAVELPRAPGTVVLDLAHADFHVQPGRPGEPLRVEATYDINSYQLQEELQEEAGAWVYRVRFRRTGSWMMSMLAGLLSGNRPEVTIHLPPDVLLDLQLSISEGGSEVELGGLWLRSAELEFERGGLNLDVREPTREPVERFSIRGSMGGFNAGGIGNASPRHLEVDFRMGGMNLDLRGAWVEDSEIIIRQRMGGGRVQLPRNVVIEGLPDHHGVTPEGEVMPPTLRIDAPQTDDLKFHD